MPGVSKEQINRAKEVDILDYLLAHETDNIRKTGNSHRLIDHDSLEISNGLWHWHSRGIGGRNAVDYLMKVRGLGFVAAVERLAGSDIRGDPVKAARKTSRTTTAKPRQPFRLPPRNGDNIRVTAYLEGRGIGRHVIEAAIRQGSLYESAGWHNCVFVGFDGGGGARYATLRGTYGDFKCDIPGSDKRFGFVLPPPGTDSDGVAVFESPIDALSHRILYPQFEGWRLSLGGTSTAALTCFMERHGNVKKCLICTDNDMAGDRVADKIAQTGGLTTVRHLPPVGKDFGEALATARGGKRPVAATMDAAKLRADGHNERTRGTRTGNPPDRGAARQTKGGNTMQNDHENNIPQEQPGNTGADHKNMEIWLRLGVTLDVPEPWGLKILDGDKQALLDVLTAPGGTNGEWHIDGETYIPEDVIDDLRPDEGVHGEISFDLPKTPMTGFMQAGKEPHRAQAGMTGELRATLEKAAAYIIETCARETTSGNYVIDPDDIPAAVILPDLYKEHLGGIVEIMREHGAVAGAETGGDGSIDVTLYLDHCPNFEPDADEEADHPPHGAAKDETDAKPTLAERLEAGRRKAARQGRPDEPANKAKEETR